MPKKTKKEIMKENEERIAQLKLLVAEKKKKDQSKAVASNLKEEILGKKKAKAQEKIGFDRRFEVSDSKAFGDVNIRLYNDKLKNELKAEILRKKKAKAQEKISKDRRLDKPIAEHMRDFNLKEYEEKQKKKQVAKKEELTNINLKEEILKKKRLKKLKQDKFDEEVERIRAGIRVFRGKREKERLDKLKEKYPFLRNQKDKIYLDWRDKFLEKYPTKEDMIKGMGRIYYDEILKDTSDERKIFAPKAMVDLVEGDVDDVVAKNSIDRLLKRWRNKYGVWGFAGNMAGKTFNIRFWDELPKDLKLQIELNKLGEEQVKEIMNDWEKIPSYERDKLPLPEEVIDFMKKNEKEQEPIKNFEKKQEKEKRRQYLEQKDKSFGEMSFEETEELLELEKQYKSDYKQYVKAKKRGEVLQPNILGIQGMKRSQSLPFERVRRFDSEIFRDELEFAMKTDYIKYFQRFNDITEEEFDNYLENLQQSLNRLTPESMEQDDDFKVELYSLADYIIENPRKRSRNYKLYSFIRGYEEDLKNAYEDVKNETFNEENLGQILTEGEEELSRDDLTKVIAQQLETYTYWNNEELFKNEKRPTDTEPYETKLYKYYAKLQKYLGSNVYNKSFMDRYS